MPRILVKAASGLSGRSFAFGAAGAPAKIDRLFESIGSQSPLGATADDAWYVVTTPPAMVEENAWDACHALVRESFGIAGTAPKFAEPDIEQRWIPAGNARVAMALAQSCDQKNPQDNEFPRNGNDYWFRDAAHSQFDAAISAIGGPDAVSRVRIAHFDTGYDPHHNALPKRLRRDIARNFVDHDYPDDASDRTTAGLFTNLGHGTGTLGILAGSPIAPATALGGAPFAEVIPVRVANSVVLFTNSTIARAFDYVHALNVGGRDRVDIITMSMGGLASRAWADAVNALYEQGVFIVTAAGNNYGNLPTSSIVYPARFNRVLAACGVMADGKPYADLAFQLMAGNYGPIGKMRTAMAAPTPNVPWARIGCPDQIDFNGSGTSAATPQIAAGAAIWLQKNRAAVDAYPESWMRVEAIRKALFESAGLASARPDAEGIDLHLGRGKLHANDALSKAPALASVLGKTAVDTVSFPLQQIFTSLGMQETTDSPRRRMLELEALQLSQNQAIESLIPADPDTALQADWRRLAEALAAQPHVSRELKQALSVPGGMVTINQPADPEPLGNSVLNLQLEHAKNPRLPIPTIRPLKVYAYDPSLGAKLDTLGINEATLDIQWEKDLKPGPIGEYIEVVDVDPASQCCYAPVDLNDPYVLTRSGLTPSEASPQFHQQMVYAVAMKTIEHFEKALGRVALWAPREVLTPAPRATSPQQGEAANVDMQGLPAQQREAHADGPCAELEPIKTLEYVQRLRIYPHALRAKNAYYSPERKALLLGYFKSDATASGLLQGNVVFTAVSHDVIAHETTHALLDGVHRRFREATNPDVLSFHEAFADIVALFQHFTLQEALRHQIAATQGKLEKQNLLGQLAVQFGEATGRYDALRNYITDVDRTTKESEKKVADAKRALAAREAGRANDADGAQDKAETKTDYDLASETGDPHAVGAVLVAAVFDAFLQIYRRRTADLIRLATNGTGVLPPGEISFDLVNRLAREASKVAGQILNICIRALDYLPPVDIVFGEYLRALITADVDLVPNDRMGYRIAFIEAFRQRGIYPRDVKHLSPGSLTWEAPPLPLRQGSVQKVLGMMSTHWDLKSKREEAYELSKENARVFHKWLMDDGSVSAEELAALGLIRINGSRPYKIGDQEGCLHGIEVHSVRPVRRVGPEGNVRADLVVEITQSFRPKGMPGVRYRGGCTLIIDLGSGEVRYMVRKKVDSLWRFSNQLKFAKEVSFGLHGNYFTDPTNAREPFAMIHHVHG